MRKIMSVLHMKNLAQLSKVFKITGVISCCMCYTLYNCHIIKRQLNSHRNNNNITPEEDIFLYSFLGLCSPGKHNIWI